MSAGKNLAGLDTERRNPATLNIDRVSTIEMLEMINDEDAKAALAVREELPNIAKAVDAIADSIGKGGRLFYIGAGTSGRIGILDASEIPPTFGVSCDLVMGIMAGGDEAMRAAKEGAEDNAALGAEDVRSNNVKFGDVVVGIAASGRTPYVIGALKEAKTLGAVTVGVSNVKDSQISGFCDIAITPVAGPEALTGSTRMKAGTMQKMTLNMLTTGAMVKLGKTYGNLMVGVVPTNEKLVDRAARIVAEAAEADYERALETLLLAGKNPKIAIVMLKANLGAEAAAALLEKNGGFVSRAVGSL